MNQTTAQPARVVLQGVPRIGFDVHPCPFPGALFAAMQYLGNPVDYDYLMGVTGAAFRRLWNRDDGGNIDLSYFGAEPFRRAFAAIGYEYRTVPAERAPMVRAIKESIGRGVPAIAFGIIGPPEAGIVAGYQGDGDLLFGWSYFQEGPPGYYEKADWFATMDRNAGKGLIVIGARQPARPSPRDILETTLQWAVTLARTRDFPGQPHHICGLAAYDAWAAGLEVDADYPADDPPTIFTRVMVCGDQVTMLHERRSAAAYLRQAAQAAPDLASHLHAAATLYQEVGDLATTLWPWDYSFDGPVRQALVDGALRRELAATIRAAQAREAAAVAHLERALAQ